MQGIFIDGQRPRSKKAVREAVAAGGDVRLEATSLFGNEYDGPVADAPDGRYAIVGPDPYTRRNFYGTVTVAAGKVSVV
jgi:ABC-type branched-subunit amino acid transport system substrate-binding protein